MSLEKKLQDAEIGARMKERARCLWCIDEIQRELHLALRKKLMTEAEIHLANVKFNIFGALRLKLRRAIITGVGPEGEKLPEPPSRSNDEDSGDPSGQTSDLPQG